MLFDVCKSVYSSANASVLQILLETNKQNQPKQLDGPEIEFSKCQQSPTPVNQIRQILTLTYLETLLF